MISTNEYITYSLDTNLFFLRIMKEHAFFLELGFMPKDQKAKEKAQYFRECFENLLSEATDMACGNVSHRALASNQFATCCTVCAEELSNDYTGIPFNISITRRILSVEPHDRKRPVSEQRINNLNKNALNLTVDFCEFKEALLRSVCDCKMFTNLYPLLIEHLLKEARFFIRSLNDLIRRTRSRSLLEEELFWNERMEEHAKFIAGLLDPCENELICAARELCREFDTLNKQKGLEQFTRDSIEATRKIRDFKQKGTKGIIDCEIKSVIIPILADHVLREANHYLCVMGECNTDCKK